MEIQITMLDVGDADAMIVHLQRAPGDQLVILVDGGHTRDGQACIDKLKPILEKAGKNGPDLIICTHYDADHVLGLISVVRYFGNEIKQVWMHLPGGPKSLSDVAHIKLNELLAEQISPTSVVKFADHQQKLIRDAKKAILESYKQMRKLETAIGEFTKIKLIQPFPKTEFEGWPEIQILGPTRAFFEECIAKINDVPKVLAQETMQILNEAKDNRLLFEAFAAMNGSPCQQLSAKRKDPVSMVNQISLIFQIIADGKKYLFTGDASIESFEALPRYPECICDVYWLKVPHHGSHNNNSPELFDKMSPKFADISGGEQYLNDLVRDCLKHKGVAVRTTRDTGTDIIFPYPAN